MNSENKSAAIYARVSSEKQDTDLSISAQLKHLREYAAKLRVAERRTGLRSWR